MAQGEICWRPVVSSFDREAWLESRKNGIGASEIASIMHENPWMPALEVWARKTGRAERARDEEEGEFQFWGHQLEDAIIRGYESRTGRAAVEFGVAIQSTQYPWLFCTPDALVTDQPTTIHQRLNALAIVQSLCSDSPPTQDEIKKHLSGWWPLQVKNTGDRQADAWVGGPPWYYQLQGLHEALVFGSTRATVAGLIGGQHLAWMDVVPDEFITRKIVNLSKSFWQDSVLADVPPHPDGTEACKEMLKALYPHEDPDKTIVFPDDIAMDASPPPFGETMTAYEFDELYTDAVERRRVAKKDVQRLENILRSIIGDAAAGVMPNGAKYSLKTRRQQERIMAGWESRVLTRKSPPKPRKKKR